MDRFFARFSNVVSKGAGRPWTFVGCLGLVIVWAGSGPLFGFGETWQLVINTSTTIITFLMVFVIQNSQNRDSAAMNAKLDELLHALPTAEEKFVGIEFMTDVELEKLLRKVQERAETIRGKGGPRVETRADQTKRAKASRATKTGAATG